MTKLKIILVFNFIFLILISSGVLAAPEQSGIKVAPATVDMVIESGDSEKVAWVGIKNNYNVPITLAAELKGVDQEGGNLTPTKELPEQLKNNLTVDKNLINLAAGESINLRLVIADVKKLMPGGNYASLVIKQATNKDFAIGLQPAISVSLFITKLDGINKQLNLETVKLNRLLWSMPKSVSLTFVNKGNVLLVPRGRVEVMANKNSISNGLINEQSSNVLPNNKIVTTTKLKNNKLFELPGKKNLLISYRYDGSDELITYQKSFIYVPFWLWLIALSFLLFTVLFLFKKPSKKINNKSKKINIKEESETTIFKFK